jgi:hypothetical protein
MQSSLFLPDLSIRLNGKVPLREAMLIPDVLPFVKSPAAVFLTTSPTIISQLTGVSFEGTCLLMGPECNLDFSTRLKLVKQWAEDTEAREEQYRVASYLISLVFKRHIPVPECLSGFIHTNNMNKKQLIQNFYSDVYNNFNLSEVNKIYLTALFGRNALSCRTIPDITPDNNLVFTRFTPRERSKLQKKHGELLFKLYGLLKSYASYFGTTRNIQFVSTSAFHYNREKMFSQKELYAAFLEWVSPFYNTELLMKNSSRSWLYKFMSGMLWRVLVGGGVELYEKGGGFLVLEKEKRIKI